MLNLGIKQVPFLIIALLFSACAFMGISWNPFRAKDVLKIRINLADTNVVNVPLGNIKNFGGGNSNSNRTYMVTAALNDESLSEPDPKKSVLRQKIWERYNQTKLFHTGEIRLKINFADGSKLDTLLQDFHGDLGMENSIMIGSFILTNTKITGLSFKINRIDSLLASELKHPVFWLYYDGGK